jgi:hypothetical protein
MKHTKGPWYIEGDNDHTDVRSETQYIANLQDSFTGHMHANARLIAAAPELLEVLRDYIDDQNGMKLLDGMELWKRMNAAVLKATGGVE